MTTHNEKRPAPEQASEAANSGANPVREAIVDARAAGGNETSSKVSCADALTADEREVLEHAAGFLHTKAATALRKLLAASPVEQPAPAPADERAAFAAWVRTQDSGVSLYDAYLHGKARASSANETRESDDPAIIAAANRGYAGGLRDGKVLGALARANEAPAEGAIALPHWFEMFLTNVCEIPDRNSPEGEPDAIVATLNELRDCALNAIEQCVSYAVPAQSAEDVRAWETNDGRVISDVQKQQALRDGGASASSVRPFHIALGKISAAQAVEPVAIGAHDLNTSDGGLSYIAEFFIKRLRRHDFGRYITERLAADFACVLAQYLREHDAAPLPPVRSGATNKRMN